MEFELTPEEVRVLGSLMEKEATTPDYYPLTLNALVNACNQKSSREPVVSYDDATVERAVDSLREKGLARLATGMDSRVRKYRQILSVEKNLTPRESALLTILFLRGPQTPGELKGRTGRMYEFGDLEEVEHTLGLLSERGYVQRLPREPGRRESRFVHLFSGAPIDDEDLPSPVPVDTGSSRSQPDEGDRVEELEQRVRNLESELESLRREFAAFREQFE